MAAAILPWRALEERFNGLDEQQRPRRERPPQFQDEGASDRICQNEWYFVFVVINVIVEKEKEV